MTANESETTVRLRFTGSPIVRRIIGAYQWSSANGHVCAVPLALAADLLTGRESDEWALAEQPRPAIRRRLAELMGLAPAELIIIAADGDSEEAADEEVNKND